MWGWAVQAVTRVARGGHRNIAPNYTSFFAPTTVPYSPEPGDRWDAGGVNLQYGTV